MKETSFVYQGKRGFFIEPMKGVWYNHHVKFPIGDNSGEHDVGIIESEILRTQGASSGFGMVGG
jgi:hypothetical protein